MIILPNIDGRIWDAEFKVLEMIEFIRHHDSLRVSLNHEGPCNRSLGLYKILDGVCNTMSLDPKKISIQTCNQIESHDDYQIIRQPPLYIEQTKDFFRQNQDQFCAKDFSNIKTIGIFIGRGNFLRLCLSVEISRRYPQNSILTYHYDSQLDFHRSHIGLEDLINRNYPDEMIKHTVEFLQSCPRKISTNSVKYPILSPSHLDICQYYQDFFCEIVCETYCMGETFYPTEKIWRPLVMKTPFIVQGPVGYLDNLRKLGFKTFSRWWDEGYQCDPYDYQPDAILDILDKFNAMTTQDLKSMYHDMLPILEHNHQRFMSLTPQDFATAFGYKNG